MPTVHRWIGDIVRRLGWGQVHRNMAVFQGNGYSTCVHVRLWHCTVHAVGLQDIHPPGRPVAEHGDRYPQEMQTIDGSEKCVPFTDSRTANGRAGSLASMLLAVIMAGGPGSRTSR